MGYLSQARSIRTLEENTLIFGRNYHEGGGMIFRTHDGPYRKQYPLCLQTTVVTADYYAPPCYVLRATKVAQQAAPPNEHL